MLKYRGIFRVQYEVDKQGKACEFTYVPCGIKRGSNICRHSDDMLNVYLTSSIVANNLLREHIDLFKPYQMGDGEATLLFPESRIAEAAEILKARVMGKGLNPRPKIKHPMTDEQKRIATERLAKYRLTQQCGRESGINGQNPV
jgi:hypothetical protein